MPKVAIVGLGRMGSAITKQLLEVADELSISDLEIFVYDISKQKEISLECQGVESLRTISEDVHQALSKLKPDLLINASTFIHNEFYTKLCLDLRINYVDLGQSTWTTIKQRSFDNLAKERRILVVPETGMAPGTINVIGKLLIDEGYEDVMLYSGGLPMDRSLGGILRYARTWSIRGLIQEYTDTALVREDGELKFIQGLDEEIEKGLYVEFKDEKIYERLSRYQSIGRRNGYYVVEGLEALTTSDGVSLMPIDFKLKRIGYKTLRYEGHYEVIKTLWKMHMFDADLKVDIDGHSYSFLDITSMMLDRIIPETSEDVALFKAIGSSEGRQAKVDGIVLSDGNYTAMQKLTGYSTVISALGILGKLDILEDEVYGVYTPYRIFEPRKYLEALFRIVPNADVRYEL